MSHWQLRQTRVAALAACAALSSDRLNAQSCANESMSRNATGSTGNGDSTYPRVSRDGTAVVFHSNATNLAPGDTNGNTYDIFVRDRVAGTIELASVSSSSGAANDFSFDGDLSGDGRLVVFESDATNLVAGDTNSRRDIFLRDRAAGTTTRVSIGTSGVQANNYSTGSRISGDGRFVVFGSLATNLDPADPTGAADVYCHDLSAGATTLISRPPGGAVSDGASSPCAISFDGRFVTFASTASNLVTPPLPPDGRVQIYVWDRTAGAITHESVTTAGMRCNSSCNEPSISDDGRFVAFTSHANDLVLGDSNGHQDVFVRDRVLGVTSIVSCATGGAQANADCHESQVSAFGGYVVFASAASNLVGLDTNGQRDTFMRDLVHGTTERIDVSFACGQLAEDATTPGVSGDGRVVVFVTTASNVVANDSNGRQDVFLRDLTPGAGAYCTAKLNSLGCLPTIETLGIASVGSDARFWIDANSVRNRSAGLFVYCTTGTDLVPLGGGVLCVSWPRIRLPIQDSGGSALPAADCSGRFRANFNAWCALGVDPALFAGQHVYGQFWGRDPGYAPPFNVTLSNAVSFVIAP